MEEQHILDYTGVELDAKLAEISTKATNTFFTTTIPLSNGANWESWYGYDEETPTYYALNIEIDGILDSDNPKIGIHYDTNFLNAQILETYSKAFSDIKAILTYNGGITVLIHEDVYANFEEDVDLPIQLEVTR